MQSGGLSFDGQGDAYGRLLINGLGGQFSALPLGKVAVDPQGSASGIATPDDGRVAVTRDGVMTAFAAAIAGLGGTIAVREDGRLYLRYPALGGAQAFSVR